MPQGVRMMCLHSQRMVDDLWQIVPKDFDNFELLYFNSYAPLGTFQGVYPTAAPNKADQLLAIRERRREGRRPVRDREHRRGRPARVPAPWRRRLERALPRQMRAREKERSAQP